MYNPRWPHKLRAYRPRFGDDGMPVFDDEGNVEMEPIVFDCVVYDPQMNPTFKADGSFVTERTEELPWGYRTATGGMSDSGDVFRTDFKISCPMFTTPLEEGLVLHLTDYDHSFEAVVKKKTSYNWGVNIWFKNPGNNGEQVSTAE